MALRPGWEEGRRSGGGAERGVDRNQGPIRRRLMMRMLMKVSMPVEPFNASVRDGSVGAKMGRALEEIRPEAVYFIEDQGKRTALLIVDVPNPSRIPALAEPWFLMFNASVEFKIAMTPEDLKASGLESLGRKYAK